VLAATLESMREAKPLPRRQSVRLVPSFDPYVIAFYKDRSYLLAPELKPRVYRKGAWVSPVVLANGRMAGVWSHEKKRAGVSVDVDLFDSGGDDLEDGIEAETARLREFLAAPSQTE
jgi:hypothetical protein